MDKFQVFSTYAVAIFLEAAPFLLLGAFFSSFIEVFLPPDKAKRFIPRAIIPQMIMGMSMGMFFPVCECGNVPVARRLIRKGFPLSLVITYMLAAPVVNPIVMWSTHMAYRGDWNIVLLRLGVVGLVAIFVASILSRFPESEVLKKEHRHHHAGCGHDHSGCGHDHAHDHKSKSKLKSILEHAAGEFLDMGPYLVFGAIASAAFKTYIPGSVISVFESNVILAVLLLMVLAVLLSVCSEADAFVAASFSNLPKLAQLSFMTTGPMVDLKLMGMFLGAFKKKAALVLIVMPFILNFILLMLLKEWVQ